MSRTHSHPDGSADAPAPAGPQPYSHCASCGAPYAEARSWPRTCAVCGATAYGNPLPVAVALQPVYDRAGTGLVVITRAIEPAKGTVALPGGFVDHAEDWRHAVVRELREETGIDAESRDVRLADALSSPDGHLLLFGVLPTRPAAELPSSVPTDETDGRHILREPARLGFPLHTLAVRAWFEGRYQ
ncbi:MULTISPECIES: NUDIX domain-containing protein [unclassified Streptomyces]|uniref:NUDIX domain-containing protein n=1 Tax=Streptomyces evansiae TaxID=3075535 RepID=A0ABD5ECW4_9ACTN|nr:MULTISPECIES: NUDIX domain-containing protein [unclassified Streptomyces]ASY35986.1 NUDIX hydrolase [Streptomyces sp. CLI2509]MDT0419045.1 NUDIX domain-containing protein [Streptomyces sp. DSM 41982]MYX23445.1 NUDIX domain-containing protein [Streptomyces sp. SID8380]SCE37385.1 ADP-ribose pyrophosphatase YjhB, NUDIX family [Streptomyces sp. SolWspMP-sol7th]